MATRGGVERRVLDVVAHAPDVVLAHRLDVEQRAAVVQVELAVPAVVHGVAEVHELRRGADVELQALEDGDDVDALVLQRLLHPLGVERAGRRPLLDGDLQHLLAAETRDAPSHSGPVDELTDQQQLGHQRGELFARQRGVPTCHRDCSRSASSRAAFTLPFLSSPSPFSAAFLRCCDHLCDHAVELRAQREPEVVGEEDRDLLELARR